MGNHMLELELKEEWRMLTSYFSSKTLFFIFPLVLFFVGFLMASLKPLVEKTFDVRELLVASHLLLAVYGIFVGGFGFFAEEVATRWFKEARLLIHLHAILPITFRRIFVWFYVKDIIYYLFLTIYPLLLGAFLSFAISPSLFFSMLISSTLSFLIGVSLSFLLSTLYVHNRLLLFGALILLVFAGIRFRLSDFPPIAFFFTGNLFSLVYSLAIAAVSVISLEMAKPIERPGKKHFLRSTLFSFADPLLAKEILDVRRSGTYKIILTSYLFPLIFLWGIFYFTGRLLNFRLDISLPFYAGFLGYLGTLVYSWLNNIDPPSSMGTLPITISEIMKRKIRLFFAASFSVSVVYLLALGYFMRDLGSLPLSLICLGSTTFYVASVTASLCGLYPNTLLFEGTILARYLAAILPVLILLSVLSFMKAYMVIFAVSLIVLFLSFFIYERLDKKYEGMYL